MKCAICGQDNWHLRTDLNKKKPVGICKECGNIQFILEAEDIKAMTDFYKYHYRQKPSTGNLLTTTRKLNYIKIFLEEFLKDKKGLICGDVGAATGYLCNYLRTIGHKATGSEMTLLFRRFSEHYYGIPLTEELEPKHKYDLISMYHVLEHIPLPDIELKRYKDMLSDNGQLFISVPEWLHELTDLSAYGNLCIENYFHENHVNCFTRNSFQNLCNKLGLDIVKADFEQYGITVMLKAGKVKPIVKDDWNKINAEINKVKLAISLSREKKLREAIDVWDLFPDAHMQLIYDVYKKDPSRQAAAFDDLFKRFPDNLHFVVGKAVWLYQYGEYEEAIKWFTRINLSKPHEDYYVYIGWCLEKLGKRAESVRYFDKAQQINPRKWVECSDLICSVCCDMPAWDERARKEIEAKAYNMNKDKIKMVDKFMEPENANSKSTK